MGDPQSKAAGLDGHEAALEATDDTPIVPVAQKLGKFETFRGAASGLFDLGYQPLPIKRGTKRPYLSAWTDVEITKKLVVSTASRSSLGAGIGIRCGKGEFAVYAADFDFLDTGVSEAVQASFFTVFGKGPLRVGRPPKALSVYQGNAGQTKLKREWLDPRGESHKFELLGDGQQFVAYGIHPDTGAPYAWPDVGLKRIAAAELPVLDFAEVADWMENELPKCIPANWTEGKSSAPRGGGSDDPFENLKSPLSDWDSDRIEEELLSHLDPDMGRNDWIKVGMALHHQYEGGVEGLDLWDAWSSEGGKYVDGECATQWDSFSNGHSANKVTLATLLLWTKEQRHNEKVEQQADVFTELSALIEATDAIELLSKVAPLVHLAKIQEAEREQLHKAISKKAKVSLGSLRADAKNFRHVEASQAEAHLNAAREVVRGYGAGNLLHTSGFIWEWDGRGVWIKTDDREIKKAIHTVADNVCLTAPVVNSILDLVKTEIHAPGHVFDPDSTRINCANGELTFEGVSWVLQPHDRESFRTSMIPVAYDPGAKAPRFEQFLAEIFEGDPDAKEKADIVLEALGYTLIPSCHLEKFFMLIGSGANGKSVLLSVVAALVGRKAVSAVQPSNFDNRFQRGHLQGKLANIVTEIAEGAEIADAQLKSFTSGELTTAEHKHKDPFEFVPYAKHWFGTNHLPHTRDFSDGLFRRAMILTFNNKFEGGKCDVHLGVTLRNELPGILNLALEGLRRLLERKTFTISSSSVQIARSWRLEADQVAQFVDEECEASPGARVASAEVFMAYQAWAMASGIKKMVSRKTLTQRLTSPALGFERACGTGGVKQIAGISLRHSLGGGEADEFLT